MCREKTSFYCMVPIEDEIEETEETESDYLQDDTEVEVDTQEEMEATES